MKLAKPKFDVEYDAYAAYSTMQYYATFKGLRRMNYYKGGWGSTPREAVKNLLRRYNRDRRQTVRSVNRGDL